MHACPRFVIQGGGFVSTTLTSVIMSPYFDQNARVKINDCKSEGGDNDVFTIPQGVPGEVPLE